MIVVSWLVDGSVWLNLFLASALASINYLYRLTAKSRQLFEIADSELVRVSALTTQLEEQIADLTSKLEDAESRIASLELDTNQRERRGTIDG